MPTVEYVSHIDDVLNATSDKLARAAEIIGGKMESYAKMKITDEVYSKPSKPNGWYIRTGNLRNSITHDTVADDHSITIAVGSNVEYAP